MNFMMTRRFMILAALIAMTSCAEKELDMKDVAETHNDTEEEEYLPGVAVVQFDDELTSLVEEDLGNGKLATRSMGLNQALDELGITSMRRLFPYAGEYEPRTRKEGLHKWYIVEYSEKISPTRAENEFNSIQGISSFQKKRKIKPTSFNDPQLSFQWGFINSSTPSADINVEPVWNYYTTGNPNVAVAVVDAGIQLDHPDLAGNVAEASLHYDSITGTSGTSQIVAGLHGTHVAGTIAAVNNNGTGVCGVAGGNYAKGMPGVKLISCQIFKTNGDKTVSGSTAAAIKWGADHGAVICQNSWAYDFDYNNDGVLTGGELSAALAAKIDYSDKLAVDYFIKYAGCDNEGNQLPNSPMKGGVVIFAAGNENITNGAPANYEPIVAVGAMASNGKKASYSNYGDFVDIAAPGTNVYSTFSNGGYGYMSGTSMACPHVSGVAALVVSACGGQGFTNDMLKDKLLNSSNKDVTAGQNINGLVDALGAITYGNEAAPSSVTDLEGKVSANTMTLSWAVPADTLGLPAYGYQIIFSTDKAAVEAAEPNSLNGASSVKFEKMAAAGDTVKARIDTLRFSTTYHLKVYSYSYNKVYSSSASEIISFTTKENNPPVIQTSYPNPLKVKSSETVTVPFSIYDPDGHSLSISYKKGSVADSFNANAVKISGTAGEPGTYTVAITATDKYGAKTSYDFSYTILENHPPVALKDPDNVLLSSIGQGFHFDISKCLSDPDEEQLTYSATYSRKGIFSESIAGNSFSGTSLDYGITQVTITGTDAKGKTAQVTFVVLVRDPKYEYALYPNPVDKILNVATGEQTEEVSLKINAQAGGEVYNGTFQASAFHPAEIDLSSLAPGKYVVRLSFGSKEFVQNIIKR